MKKHKRSRKKRFNYFQEWGTYNIDTLVSVGTSYDQLLNYATRLKAKKDNLEALRNGKEKIISLMERPAMFIDLPNGNILWIKKYEDKWEFYEILVHELFHAVYMVLGQDQRMLKEEEAMAYQIEFLFREIGKKLRRHFL